MTPRDWFTVAAVIVAALALWDRVSDRRHSRDEATSRDLGVVLERLASHDRELGKHDSKIDKLIVDMNNAHGRIRELQAVMRSPRDSQENTPV